MDRIPQAAKEALKHYVYRLVDPRNGETFYVGKGEGDRVLHHGWEALAPDAPTEKLRRITEIRESGGDVMLVIHRYGMDHDTALMLEAALIEAYRNLTNLVSGHGKAFTSIPLMDLIAWYAPQPADIRMPAILIKVEREWRPDPTPAELYERTRRYWKANPASRMPPPTHSIAIAHGLVREVYRIQRWEEYRSWPADRDMTRDEGKDEAWTEDQNHLRRGFVGSVCSDHGARLRGCTVAELFKPGTRNPIAYVNC